MDGRTRTVVAHVVEFVARSEIHRPIVVVGIPILFAALLWEGNNLGIAAVLFAAGLAAILYTRPTARQTIAAGAYATGVLAIGLVVLALYWNWSQGSTEPYVRTVTRYLGRIVAGTLLLGLGLWLRRVEI